MEEKKPFNINDIFARDAERKRQKHQEKKVILFKDYLELVKQDPLIAQNSPARLFELIKSHGIENIPDDQKWDYDNGQLIDTRYKLYSGQLFGLEKPIYQLVKYFEAGAYNLSTGKQILLLIGPTASGKSTILTITKKALENYRLRSIYAIKGCPIHEEPLHIVPRYLRDQFSEEYKVRIAGDLCPVCKGVLENEYTDKETGVINWLEIPVDRFTFSIQGTRGIGSFEPADEKSQDISELVGREDIQISSKYGPNHPKAFNLSSGELGKSNRGVLEGRELIKCEKKHLWVFISIAEEKEMKVQGSTFPPISLDTVIIGHTNTNEYKKFKSDPGNKALHDRILTIPVPSLLHIRDEKNLYKKLIKTEGDYIRLTKCHIAPGVLDLAALFAVMTRLNDSHVPLLTKAKLYNGDKALTEMRDKDKRPIDVRALREDGQKNDDIEKREGMFGVSARDVLTGLNLSLVKARTGCLTPLNAIRGLREMFDQRMGHAPEEVSKFKRLLEAGEGNSVMAEYKEFVVTAVTKAFLKAYGSLARTYFDRYVEEVIFERGQNRKFTIASREIKIDDMTGRPKEPDLKFLRSIEQYLRPPVSESEAAAYRGEILQIMSLLPSFSYDTYQPLAQAVNDKLLADNKATLRIVVDPMKVKDEESKKRAYELLDEMKTGSPEEDERFCDICTKETIEKAGEFLAE